MPIATACLWLFTTGPVFDPECNLPVLSSSITFPIFPPRFFFIASSRTPATQAVLTGVTTGPTTARRGLRRSSPACVGSRRDLDRVAHYDRPPRRRDVRARNAAIDRTLEQNAAASESRHGGLPTDPPAVREHGAGEPHRASVEARTVGRRLESTAREDVPPAGFHSHAELPVRLEIGFHVPRGAVVQDESRTAVAVEEAAHDRASVRALRVDPVAAALRAHHVFEHERIGLPRNVNAVAPHSPHHAVADGHTRHAGDRDSMSVRRQQLRTLHKRALERGVAGLEHDRRTVEVLLHDDRAGQESVLTRVGALDSNLARDPEPAFRGEDRKSVG